MISHQSHVMSRIPSVSRRATCFRHRAPSIIPDQEQPNTPKATAHPPPPQQQVEYPHMPHTYPDIWKDTPRTSGSPRHCSTCVVTKFPVEPVRHGNAMRGQGAGTKHGGRIKSRDATIMGEQNNADQRKMVAIACQSGGAKGATYAAIPHHTNTRDNGVQVCAASLQH